MELSPRPLGSHGTGLWNRVQSEYRIDDCGGIELLAEACLNNYRQLGAYAGRILKGESPSTALERVKTTL